MDNITIFTTPECVFCHALMEWLEEKGLNFKEVDISDIKNRAEAEELLGHEIQSVPVSYAYGKEIIGFDRPSFRKIIKAHKND